MGLARVGTEATPISPPREIAFLADYGAPREDLIRAAKIASEIGVNPEAALLGEGLVSEEMFYRALADRIGAPYHAGRAALDTTASPARALNAGLVYLAPLAAPYRAIAAPRGSALRLLIQACEQGRGVEGLAITSPRRLGALVRLERGREIAARAALSLERNDPALCALGELRLSQTLTAAGIGFGTIALAIAAPALERTLVSLAMWTIFTCCVWLRAAAAMAADTPREAPPLADADLPVYTVIVAMYREAEVVPKLIAGLNGFDYPGIMAQPPQEK